VNAQNFDRVDAEPIILINVNGQIHAIEIEKESISDHEIKTFLKCASFVVWPGNPDNPNKVVIIPNMENGGGVCCLELRLFVKKYVNPSYLERAFLPRTMAVVCETGLLRSDILPRRLAS
jgi:hypothetical protein